MARNLASIEIAEIIKEVAAEIILPRFENLKTGDIRIKGDDDPVTIADLEAEVALTKALSVTGASVVGEEACYANPDLEYALADLEHAFVIDPIDGTRNFTKNNPNFAVMVAELKQGYTTRSWIWLPIAKQMFYAEQGNGAYCNNQLLPKIVPHLHPWVGRGADNWIATDEIRIEKTSGSCGVDYPKLAQGEIDFLIYRKLHAWDHLAGVLLNREVGASARLVSGADYSSGFKGRDLMVITAQDVEDIIRREVKIEGRK